MHRKWRRLQFKRIPRARVHRHDPAAADAGDFVAAAEEGMVAVVAEVVAMSGKSGNLIKKLLILPA